nr:respiratory nitrate reductase subunit gamma [Gammaproteobacteria bacterium]
MSLLTVVYAVLFYVATLIFVAGIAHKVWQYARTPAPLKIPTTPAPTTKGGVVLRMFREVVFFESLFKGTKWTWLFGWLFHLALLLEFIRHLRYVTFWNGFAYLQPLAYAGFIMLLGLGGLLARRFLVDRVRYISAPSDHLMLVLLMAIAGSGLLMTYVEHTDIVALKAFMLGLLYFDWQPLPTDGLLLVHLGLVVLLMMIFPFSKLLHAPGVFFSPSRNQVDNPRERRHVASWARGLESSPTQS